MSEQTGLHPHKAWAAVLCVVLALVGVLTGWRWLTVAALVIWVLVLIRYGFGQRHSPPVDPGPTDG